MEKRYKILLNDSVFSDLETIPSKFISKILEKIIHLETFPELGVSINSNKWNGYRQLIVDYYRVLYQIDKKKKIINVRFVKHGKMNFPK